jgi:hypothetical protein
MPDNPYVLNHYSQYFHARDVKADIPDAIVHINDGAFRDHTRIKKVTIHEKVKKIGTSAFEGCTNLTKVRFLGESELVVIPEKCFLDCSSLTHFKIPPEVGVIKKYAFSGCTGIDHLVIPDHVIAVEAGAFDKWTPNQTIETHRNFKFGLVCKATILQHGDPDDIVDEEAIYETKDGQYFYAVTCKCGHVGRHRYMPITFPVVADSKKDAARIARDIPRVKHDHKDAILGVKQISLEEFQDLQTINNNDPYLKMKSKYQQKEYLDLIEERALPETGNK